MPVPDGSSLDEEANSRPILDAEGVQRTSPILIVAFQIHGELVADMGTTTQWPAEGNRGCFRGT